MAKLTEARRRVLTDFEASGGTQTHHTAFRLGIVQTSVQSAAQWLRKNGLAEYVGYWRITPAGRLALSQDPKVQS